jgi:hypothetical protein
MVWKLLHSHSTDVFGWSQNDFQDQKIILTSFGKLWWNCYPVENSIPYYLHIIVVHSISIWKKYGSMLRLSNQGSESVNHFHNLMDQRIGCNGGLNHSQSKDMLEYFLKILLYRDEEVMKEFELFLKQF